MKGLLIKDFMLMKEQKRQYLFVIALGIMMAVLMDNPAFVIGYVPLVGAAFATSSISYDEYDNGSVFLFTLPVTREGYTREKYVFGMILGCSFWLFGAALGISVEYIRHPEQIRETIFTALMVLPIIMAVQSVLLPIQLKFGSEKGNMVKLLVMGFLIGSVFAFINLVEEMGMDPGAWFGRLEQLGMGMTVVLSVLAGIILLLVSLRISVQIMGKREF